jgi:hypothetical protein
MKAPTLTTTLLAALVLAEPQATQQAGSAGQTSPVTFKNDSAAAGIEFVHANGASPEKFLVETMGSGAVLFDYNNDGRLDIFLVDGGALATSVTVRPRHRLYTNRGDGTFDERGMEAGIRHTAYGQGACAGDIDNDGWNDLYITNLGPNVLYRNTGKGAFADISAQAGVTDARWGASCAFFDLDRDGDLDLFVTNYVDASATNNPRCGDTLLKTRDYCHPLIFNPHPNVLYRNDGHGRFTDISAQAGLAALKSNGLGVVVTDVDDDGWPDVFVANDGMPNFLFRNLAGKRFEEKGLLAGVAVAPDGRPRAGMGVASGDYDGDGRSDLVVTNLWGETHSLFRSMGSGLFAYATVESGIGPWTRPFVGFGTAFVDYDNDTNLDLVIVNGAVVDDPSRNRTSGHQQRPLLLRNVGSRRFQEVGRLVGSAFAEPRVGRGLAAGDIDNDGDLDLVVTSNGGRADLLINDGGNSAHSLLVRTIGTTGNRNGIGARLVMKIGTRTLVREVQSGSSYLSQNDARAHFGLGAAAKADRLEIRWPGGRVDVLKDVQAGELLTVREGEGIIARERFRPISN